MQFGVEATFHVNLTLYSSLKITYPANKIGSTVHGPLHNRSMANILVHASSSANRAVAFYRQVVQSLAVSRSLALVMSHDVAPGFANLVERRRLTPDLLFCSPSTRGGRVSVIHQWLAEASAVHAFWLISGDKMSEGNLGCACFPQAKRYWLIDQMPIYSVQMVHSSELIEESVGLAGYDFTKVKQSKAVK